ncbi:MAG: DinB family protein [Bacteroidetes bacterium]|nr:DinB family protein [Bacteroidota bacterium]MBS1630794.1 DinB family protein [Bacteroidota bacterium]
MSEHNYALVAELQHEAANTRKMFERIPEEQFEYAPHEKSTRMGRLAGHIAQLTGWPALILNTDELDFASGTYAPFIPTSRAELLQRFDEELAASLSALQEADKERMMQIWAMRAGDHIIASLPKAAMIRSAAINHFIHHRGQLSVYLRLNNAPVPGMYGPSADEH